MVDIHCHILPGLDDGPQTMEVALEMAESAIGEGISHVIATPHASNSFCFVPELVQARRDELQSQLGSRLRLATGCDFHLSYENLQDLRGHAEKYTLNQKNYLLVEFADYSVPPSMDQTLHELQLAGLYPVITHPERNPLIRTHSERLLQWVRQGCLVQITAQSLLGRFGEAAKAAAEGWLDSNAVHFVASDAHNTTSRPLRLSTARELVKARKGSQIAEALFIHNPLAAFEGQPLPYVPEPGGPRARPNVAARRKRFGWF